MPPDSENLRAILRQYVGPAYDRALRNTGSDARAREATRRAMELLKRSLEEGVEPNKALVLRITDDCCNQNAFYNRQPEPSLAAPVAQAARPPSPSAEPLGAARPNFLRPTPAVEVGTYPVPARELSARAAPARDADSFRPRAEATEELDLSTFLAEERRKAALRPKDKVSPGPVLLLMILSLLVVVLVVVLVVMLSSGAPLRWGAGFGSNLSAWFNAHIFPLN